jgi:hypothetical protein
LAQFLVRRTEEEEEEEEENQGGLHRLHNLINDDDLHFNV